MGDIIIVLLVFIGGYVIYYSVGCVGFYGLRMVEVLVCVDGYIVDLDCLCMFVLVECFKLIMIGGSLNLFEYLVVEVCVIVDEIGVKVMFDVVY